ncbi:protein-disulfide reductase DsbD [Parendozoicomonas haliclonae]|uniref:Thiol:disulfide interchange protein DsbD n=1 Tax=Parendozoicomonas haliclonae TaxID=1960125 RepID=A0A1X7AFE5_9GAMM|nr:protein-disulfide reductase DsbD [Parendozoicomonas haliclonae]SMA36113.1 Thiol:disulfide interchange protein DsbD precursor [Parendozoicomonas haliclonae]
MHLNTRLFFPAFSILLAFLLCFSAQSQAISFNSLLNGDNQKAEFLPVDEAFQVSGEILGGDLIVKFAVTPEHYLYRHMLSFQPADSAITSLGAPLFPEGITKYDQFMREDVETYPTDMEVTLPINSTEELPEIIVSFQGCADAGLCYPPTSVNIIPITTGAEAASLSNPSSTSALTEASVSDQPIAEDSFLASLINGASLGKALLLFYLGGLALTFTPCVLPMIPIVSSLVANAQGSRRHRVTLTLFYVLAMAMTYAIAGMLMGYFGASLNLQARLQSPWLLIPFAILFVILALSMFGLFELQLPEKLRDKLSKADQQTSQKRKGTITGAILAGIFSTLLVSPCVSAPLAGALVYISSTGDVAIGGLTLFVLGLGMGTPLLIVGIGGASLLPKAGPWMNGIKSAFGVLMLGVAVWLLERIIPESATLLLWGALATGCAVYLGALNFTQKAGWAAFRQVIGVLLLVYGVCLLVGGIQGHSDPLRPLGEPATSQAGIPYSDTGFTTLTTSQQLEAALQQAARQGKPTFIDFYADWCISCKVFEREVLALPEVQKALAPFSKIKLDITDNSADHQAILSRYKLFGPPAYLFYSKTGQELDFLHRQGEISAETLLTLLKKSSSAP